jgi:hypothetical protein
MDAYSEILRALRRTEGEVFEIRKLSERVSELCVLGTIGDMPPEWRE